MPVKVAPKKIVAKRISLKPSKSNNGSAKKTKMVYYFGGGKADGDGSMKPSTRSRQTQPVRPTPI